MAAGDPFTSEERYDLDATIRKAERSSRVEFSVFVGAAQGGDPRAFATSLHNSLVAPARSILIMVDPTARLVEVVTGGWVRRTLRDQQVEQAVAAMQGQFAEGDLAGGLKRGITMLAEQARAPETLHAAD
ncbi:DUF5130 family protein [Nocardioides sp. SYSU D00038]|uniref:DUF5130 family protein n=1 Tax=Nocardioides sp. SYSU D00038 TaxID=2812554 RepID=UPI001968403C|nr:DUF5130 family protein [Nocardioides sp. SYSU D00038]